MSYKESGGRKSGWEFHVETGTRSGSVLGRIGGRKNKVCAKLLLEWNDVVLLELAVKSGLADAKDTGSGNFVAIGFAQGANDGAAFEFLKRNNFVFLR